MRVAIIGAHGTGKTTLARGLAQALNMHLINEAARIVAHDMGYTPATIPDELVVAYQQAILDEQIDEESSREAWISDRSVVDNMAYLVAQVERLNIPVATVLEYHRKAYPRLEHYDALIFVPIAFDLELDGERHADLEFQDLIEETLLDILDELEAAGHDLARRTYTVTSVMPADRVAEVLTYLGRLKHGTATVLAP